MTIDEVKESFDEKLNPLQKDVGNLNRKIDKLFNKYDDLRYMSAEEKGKNEMLKSFVLDNKNKIEDKADKEETRIRFKTLWAYIIASGSILGIVIVILTIFVFAYGG